MKKIYTITTIQSDGCKELNDLVKSKKFDSRAWGWETTLEKAIKLFSGVSGEFYHELCYDYIVVEETSVGVSYKKRQESWFKWNKSKKRWVSCKKPRFSKQIVCWGLG